MAKGPSVRMWRRTLVVMIAITVLGFGLVIGSLFRVTIVDGKDLQQRAVEQSLRNTSLRAQRGIIYDVNGNVLAKSASVWTVILEPAYIKDDETRGIIADGLSEILDMDRETIMEKAKQQNYYTYLKREVETEIKDEILAFMEEKEISRGIILEEAYKRYYPYGTLASTVLGFTGTDDQGLAGIEAEYDTELSGTAGRLVTAKNAIGTDMPFEYEQQIDPQNGYNLHLTLDEVVQSILEKHLNEGVEQNKVANGAAGILMNVNTGAIVAMAGAGNFDPNDPFSIVDSELAAEIEAMPDGDEKDDTYNNALQAQWRNKAVNDTYYPGSVFKMVTAAIGMEEGIINENTTYTCTGAYHHPDFLKPINCWRYGGHGTQTFVEGLCNSCNPFFIDIGQKIGPSTFYKYFEAFGLTEKTGIDLPGESGSIYFSEERLETYASDLATLSFGQNFSITPLQMVTACATIVNGGKLVTPHVMDRITDSEGNIVEVKETQIKRQVISEDISERLSAILQKNGESGTAKNGYVAGFRIGGKTGTSEKVAWHNEHPDEQMRYIASYCGFAPADDPQYALLILFDEPLGDSYYGGAVAGPVFAKVMEEVLPYLGVERQYTESEMQELDLDTPAVVGKTVSEAKSILENAEIVCRIEGSGDTVLDQIPYEGNSIPKGGTVVLFTDNKSLEERVVVPDFEGMTLAEANESAAASGIQITLGGAAANGSDVIAHSQSVAAGKSVKPGTVVQVMFIELDQVQ